MDSIRWEIFAEALQDYAILQTAGIPRHSELLKELETYGNFPKNEQWIKDTMRKILTQPAQK